MNVHCYIRLGVYMVLMIISICFLSKPNSRHYEKNTSRPSIDRTSLDTTAVLNSRNEPFDIGNTAFNVPTFWYKNKL